MKIKYIIVFSVLIMFTSCKGQSKEDNKKQQQKQAEMTTEKFNIETFEKNKDSANDYYFTLEDGTEVRQVGGSVDYAEYLTPPPPELYSTYKQYFLTGELQKIIVFYQDDFDVSKKVYNKKGELIESVNYDTPFKFSFEQLLELLKKQEDTIDLTDRNTSISRGIIEGNAIWEVEYKKYEVGYDERIEHMTIDGITGEILKKDFIGDINN